MLKLISYLIEKISSHIFLFFLLIAILALGSFNIPKKLETFRDSELKITRLNEVIATLKQTLEKERIKADSEFKIPKTSDEIASKRALLEKQEADLIAEKQSLQKDSPRLWSIPGTEPWLKYQVSSYKLELLSPFIATLRKYEEEVSDAEDGLRIYLSSSQSLIYERAKKEIEIKELLKFEAAQNKYSKFYEYCRNTRSFLQKNLVDIENITRNFPSLSKIPFTEPYERIEELRALNTARADYEIKHGCEEKVKELETNISNRKSLQREVALIDKKLESLKKPSGLDSAHVLTDYSGAEKLKNILLDRLQLEIRMLTEKHQSNFLYQIKTAIDEHWKKALTIMLLGLIAPLVSAFISYFGLAILISNRFRIIVERKTNTERLIKSNQEKGRVAITNADELTLSIGMEDGEVLTVRPEFIGSAPDRFSKNTLWIFNARRPLMCITAHLINMARIQATHRDDVVLRAPEGEHIRLALVTIPSGEALVVRPKGVIGFLEPEGLPLKVRSVWRLLSLQCWMRLQLRFILIDGPGSIIVRGHNGVRVEEATGGRAIAQSATLAYSAHANYSMTRACQRQSKFPQLRQSNFPHPVQTLVSSARTSPAFSFSFKRYEFPRMLSVTA